LWWRFLELQVYVQSPPLVCVIVPSSSSFSFPDGLDVQPQFVSRRRDPYELGLHVEPIGEGEGGGGGDDDADERRALWWR
jgi:hypothetical protein